MFGDRNEARRRNFAVHRMRPARQRLDADNAVARGVDDRLIGGADLVVLDGFEQVAFEQFAARQIGVHGGVIDAGAVAAFVLGAIERHVGIAQNVGGIADTAVDDGDADRGADDDVVAADRIGRAERIDDAAGDSLQRVGIGFAGGDDGEFVAAEPRHQILAAHDAAQPLGDVENELVADVMAERVVDVLEVIEIDIEHGGRRAAGAHIGDDAFEPVAEIDAVGQAADRIVQREMTQLPLAGVDFLRGAAHMAKDEADKEGEARERDGDERHHALHDGGARLGRRPGETRNRAALRIEQVHHAIAAGLRRIVDRAQAGELQVRADAVEKAARQIFDRQHDRRFGIAFGELGVGADRHSADKGRLIPEALHQHRAAARHRRILALEHRDRVTWRAVQAAAQKIETRRKLRHEIVGAGVGRIERVAVDQVVVGVDNGLDVAVEVFFQPRPDVPVDPFGVVTVANLGGGDRGRGGALQEVQRTQAVVGCGLSDKLLLGIEGDFVGALRGGQNRDDDTDDGDGNDYADRHDQADARLIPPRLLTFPGDMRPRRRHHASTYRTKCWADTRKERLRMTCA